MRCPWPSVFCVRRRENAKKHLSRAKVRELLSVFSMLTCFRPENTSSWLKNIFNRYHLFAAGLHFIQCTVSYALMLAAMTYNTWVLVSLAGGFATGYLFFGWFAPKKITSSQTKPLLGENEHDPCCN